MAGGADFLFSIGADATAANAAVDEFVARTNRLLGAIQQVKLSSTGGITNQKKLLDLAGQRLAVEQKIASIAAGGGGLTDISGVAGRNAAAIGKQKDALDMLNRILGNTVFKFVEYELIMKGFNGAVSEVMNSLNQASNVQMEQTLQHIYNAQIDTNQALKDAIIIAKQWGSSITDVQQAIGLWTKQTSQMTDANGNLVDSQKALAAAALLAADAEKFHRISGIESLEVYNTTVAVWHQLGLTLKDIPDLYDKVAYAATKISPVLKAQPGTTSKQEGIKSIWDSMAQSAAVLKAQGMTENQIIATVATSVEMLNKQGAAAGQSISSMFGALDQGGKPLKAWVKAMGGFSSFEDNNKFLAEAVKHVNDLKKAQAEGEIRVRPGQADTWKAFINNLENIKNLSEDIGKNSKGVLNELAQAQMATYAGQVDRLKAAFQEFNLELGTKILPTATRFIQFLSGSAMPVLTAHAGALVHTAQLVAQLGAAYLGVLGVNRVVGMFQNLSGEIGATNLAQSKAAVTANILAAKYTAEGDATKAAAAQQLDSQEAVDDATAAMNRQKAALDQLIEKQKLVEWQTKGLGDRMKEAGVTTGELAAMTETKLPSALATAGSAMKGFASTVFNASLPLLAMLGTMKAVAAFADAHSSQGAADVGLEDRVYQTLGVTGQHFWDNYGFRNVTSMNAQHGWFGGNKQAYSAEAAMIDEATSGYKLTKDQHGNLVQVKIEVKPGSLDWQIRKAIDAGRHAKTATDRDMWAQTVISLAKTKFQQQYQVPGYGDLDDPNAQMRRMMGTVKGGTSDGLTMPDNLDTSTKKKAALATEQQIASEITNNVKRQSMAEISHWRDVKNAAASYIKTLEELAKVHGYTHDIVTKMAGAYNTEYTALTKLKGATQEEIAQLQSRQSALEILIAKHHGKMENGKLVGGDGSSAVVEEAKNWNMAAAAIEKATGFLSAADAQVAALEAKRAEMNHAATWSIVQDQLMHSGSGLAQIGATGVRSTVFGGVASPYDLGSVDGVKGYLQQQDDNYSKALTPQAKLQASQTAYNNIIEEGTVLYKAYLDAKKQGLPVDADLVEQIIAYSDAAKTMLNNQTEAAKAQQALNKSFADTFSNLSLKNADGIVSLMGLGKGDLEAQKTMIDGLKEIADVESQIADLKTAGTQDDLAKAAALQNQVNLYSQILPMLAEQERLQSSIAYQATLTTIEKTGEEGIDQAINKLLGANQQTASARAAQYKKAVQEQQDGTYMSPMAKFASTYLKNFLDGWWKQQATNTTNTLFHGVNWTQKLSSLMPQNTLALQHLTQILQQIAQRAGVPAKAAAGALAGVGGAASGSGAVGIGVDKGSWPMFGQAVGVGMSQTFGTNGKPMVTKPSGNGSGIDGTSLGTNSNAIVTKPSADASSPGSKNNPMYSIMSGPNGTTTPTQSDYMVQAVQMGVEKGIGSASDDAKASAGGSGSSGSGSGSSNQSGAPNTSAASALSGTGAIGGMLGQMLGPLQQLDPNVTKALNSQTGQAITAGLGSIAGGYAMGQAIGGPGSTDSTWGAVGGAVGFGLGFGLTGNPAIGQAAGALGGMIGGLFGFKPNPVDEPDVYDSQNYGTFMADMQGNRFGANGTLYPPEPQFDRRLGRLSASEQMMIWANAHPTDPLSKQIKALGTNITPVSERQGILTLADGKTVSVTTMEGLFQQWKSKANQALPPIISIASYGGGGMYGSSSQPFGGGGGGGGLGSAYNTPGLSSSDFQGMEQGWINGQYGGSTSSSVITSPTSSPISSGGGGAGGTSPAGAWATQGGSLNVVVSTPVYLDGKVIAKIVNAYNAQASSNNGTLHSAAA